MLGSCRDALPSTLPLPVKAAAHLLPWPEVAAAQLSLPDLAAADLLPLPDLAAAQLPLPEVAAAQLPLPDLAAAHLLPFALHQPVVAPERLAWMAHSPLQNALQSWERPSQLPQQLLLASA